MSPSGKAPDFDSGIRWFESSHPSQNSEPLAQSVEHLTFNQGVPRSSRGWLTKFICGCNSVVEFHLAKVKVASSNLVTRSRDALVAQLDRASDYESEGQGFESLRARHFPYIFNFRELICRYSSVGRAYPW